MSREPEGPDLSLDPLNPPKYCPQCAWGGVKSKVKKLKVDPASQELVIMCKNEKCPWPFSVRSPSEVTVSDGSSGASYNCKKSRRKEDHVETVEIVSLPNKEIPTAVDSEISSQDILSHVPDVNKEDTYLGGSISEVAELNKTEDEDMIKLEISNPQYDLDLLDFESEDDGEDYVHAVATAFEGVADEMVEIDIIKENLNIVHKVSLSEKARLSITVVENNELEQENESVVKEENAEDGWKVTEQMLPSYLCLPDLLTPLPLTPQPLTPQTVSPGFAEVAEQVDVIQEDVDSSTDKSKINMKCEEDLTGLNIDEALVMKNVVKSDLYQEESCTPFKSISKRKVSGDDGDNLTKKKRGRPCKQKPSNSSQPDEAAPTHLSPPVFCTSHSVQNEKSPNPTHNQHGMLVHMEHLPPGLIPCSPPTSGPLSPEQLDITQPFHPMFGPVELCSTNSTLAASSLFADNGLSLLPSISSTSVDFVSASKTAYSFFDIDDIDNDIGKHVKAEIVYMGSIETANTSIENVVEDVANAVMKPERTFKRTPKKPLGTTITTMSSLSNKLYLHTGLDIEAEVLPRESDLSLPTLAISDWQVDDTDYATVRKLGTGVTLDRELGEMNFDEGTLDTIYPTPQEEKGNSVVFHVANQTMTTQPFAIDNLEVKEQGTTRVLLTAGSDQLKLEDLKKDTVQFNFKPGRGRGRPSSSNISRGSGQGRGRRRSVGIKPRQQESCSGWFLWRDWTVDGKFIQGFSDHMQKIVIKWNLPKNSQIDPRVQALLKEKESETVNKVTTQKVISFFAEVFVKYLYIQTNFPTLRMDKLMDILQKHHTLENQQFAVQIRSLMLQQQPAGSTEMICRGTQTGQDTRGEEGHKSAYKELITPLNNQRSTNQSTDPTSPTKAHCSFFPTTPVVSVLPEYSSKTTTTTSHFTNLNSSHQSDSDPVDLSTPNRSSLSLTASPVYSDCSCSVEVITVSPTTSHDAVGHGVKLVQFFYTNTVEGSTLVFPPVRVSTEQEVNFVVALVTEMAEEYNRRNNIKGSNKPEIQYSTEAAMARSMLDEQVVSHIKRCFTKKGMKEMKLGRKQWTKRNDIIIPSDKSVIKKEMEESEHDVENEEKFIEEMCQDFDKVIMDETVQEHVPTEDELKLVLEEKLFGGHLPKTVRRLKPPRTGASDRKGRGGRNESTKKNVPESLVLGAVELILDSRKSKNGEEPEQHPPSITSMAGLIRKRKSRRKTINIDFDNLSDDEDDDYKAPSVYNMKSDRPNEKNKRKSSRLREKQIRVDSGEYFDAENHEFEGNQKTSEMSVRFPLTDQDFSRQATQQPYDSSSTLDDCDQKLFSTYSSSSVETATPIPTVVTNNSQMNQFASNSSPAEMTVVKYIANVNENYLRSSKKSPKAEMFDQVYTRKKHFEKVMNAVKKRKVKSEKNLYKKYKGFGEEVNLNLEIDREIIKEEKNVLRKVKKAQVSEEEADLIKELLEYAESEVNSKYVPEVSVQQGSSNDSFSIEAIQEFEEFVTLESDYTEDVHTLFELK